MRSSQERLRRVTGAADGLTFLIAFALAAVVGFVFQTAPQLLRLESRVGVVTIFGVALILNIVLLIGWRAASLQAPSFHPLFLLADVILFPASTGLGVLAGGLSSVIAVGIWRKVIGLRRTSDQGGSPTSGR